MMKKLYVETFDTDPGGWLGWVGGGGGPKKLELCDGTVTTRSPWGVDFNHAPPGAGYLHLLFTILTGSPESYPHGRFDPLAGHNRFVHDNYPRDFTNAKFTLRIKGELDAKGSQLALLIQSRLPTVQTNHVLTGQPFRVTRDWSEQTIVLEPDPKQWIAMGVRSSGADNANYGNAPIGQSLRDVNVDLILVLFPLDIVPASPIQGDPHQLRAGKDYPLDRTRLPSGHVTLDEIRIEFATP